MRSLCVYCGSSPGADTGYLAAADDLATAMTARNISLVYGGASIGMMGRIADKVLENGGRVTGVIPRALADLEIAHQGLTELILVEDMHERKSRMAEAAEGFVAMPGGLGTLEELFEVWTWSQLGIHNKPVGILNAMGFYDQLIGFLDWQVSQGYVKPAHRDILQVDDGGVGLVDRLREWTPTTTSKLPEGFKPV